MKVYFLSMVSFLVRETTYNFFRFRLSFRETHFPDENKGFATYLDSHLDISAKGLFERYHVEWYPTLENAVGSK